jgi:hypothetical protein
MCQYLFAAYSLKRSVSEGLSEVQLEQTRGWGALMTLVARQEMEHMGLVLNLLTAIGGTPYFQRPNFPQRKSHYGKLGIKSELTRFDQETIKARSLNRHIPSLAPNSARRAASRAKRLRAVACAAGFRDGFERAATAVTKVRRDEFTSVQDLYVSLAAASTVGEQIGEKNLFNGNERGDLGRSGHAHGAGSMDDPGPVWLRPNPGR